MFKLNILVLYLMTLFVLSACYDDTSSDDYEDYEPECINFEPSENRMIPSQDKVRGRYVLETFLNIGNEEIGKEEYWWLRLTYNMTLNQTQCNEDYVKKNNSTNFSHYFSRSIDYEVKCEHVCLNTTLDHIITGCYEVVLIPLRHTTEPIYLYQYINSSLTLDQIKNTRTELELHHFKRGVHVVVHTAIIQNKYKMYMCSTGEEKKCMLLENCLQNHHEELTCVIQDPDSHYKNKRIEFMLEQRHLRLSYFRNFTYTHFTKDAGESFAYGNYSKDIEFKIMNVDDWSNESWNPDEDTVIITESTGARTAAIVFGVLCLVLMVALALHHLQTKGILRSYTIPSYRFGNPLLRRQDA